LDRGVQKRTVPPTPPRETSFLGEPFSPNDPRLARSRGVPGHLLGLLLFLATFALTARGIQALLRPVPTSIVLAKIQEIERDETGFDVIFLGNSHVLREIDPEVFDRAAAEFGHPLRSYNLGAQGMPSGELEFVVRRLLEGSIATPEWIFIDLTLPWSGEIENLGSRRTIAWHDLDATAHSCAALLGAPLPGGEKVSMLGDHLEDFVAHQTSKGRGLEFLDWLAGGCSDEWEVLLDHRRGHQPLTRELGPGFARRNDRFLATKGAYLREVQRLAGDRTRLDPLPPAEADDLRRLIDRIEAAGVRVVFTMPPVVAPTVRFLNDTGRESEPLLLLFNDSRRYPGLYPVERRFDLSHLNGEGARVFSRVLARAFCRRLDEMDSD
jgi:hypothetical protein